MPRITKMPFMDRHRATGKGITALVASLALTSCMAPLELDDEETGPLVANETRSFELRFMRFNVQNYEESIDRERLLELPQRTREQLWLMDLELLGNPSQPRLVNLALEQLAELPSEDLSLPARNLQQLLTMTPDNMVLSGTSFEELHNLSALIGISDARVLADLLGIDVEDRFLDSQVIAEAFLKGIISSHPAAQLRPGPVNDQHPEGLYPVTPNALPVTLEDAATNFMSMAERFGPVDDAGAYHPGIVSEAPFSQVLEDDFRMTVRANANALPYRGVDLSEGDLAAVNSLGSQINDLFDFSDPDWLQVEGLVQGVPVMEEMTMRVVEDPSFHSAGRSPFPSGWGSSSAWSLPPWTLERVIIESAREAYQDLNGSVAYTLPGEEDAVVSIEVEDGWISVYTDGGIGSPPAPTYVWDLLLEVAQVRLHDGGLEEGEASAEFRLENIPVGIDSEQIEATIRENLKADPSALIDVAEFLIDTSFGDADFYYFRDDEGSDWLHFITEDDIAVDDTGTPLREYTYARPGFFSDPSLDTLVSTTEAIGVNLDDTHHKVILRPSDTLYVQDDLGDTYRIDVLDKPGRSTIAIEVTRTND